MRRNECQRPLRNALCEIWWMKEISDRLQWARKEKGFKKAVDAARAYGWVQSTYLGHENGDRKPSRPTALKYAKRYGISVEWLFDGKGDPRGEPSDVIRVPVLSWVSAGKFRDVAQPLPLSKVPLLAFSDLGSGDFFALRVEGDSMDRISPEGSIIIVDRSDQTLVRGKPYVFSLRGDTTYKLWETGEVDYLRPNSTNGGNAPIFPKKDEDLAVVGRVRRTMLDL
jgi:SOS-response transcriptional repressor LexA